MVKTSHGILCVQLWQFRENSLESKWMGGVGTSRKKLDLFSLEKRRQQSATHAKCLPVFRNVTQRMVTNNFSCLSHVRHFANVLICKNPDYTSKNTFNAIKFILFTKVFRKWLNSLFLGIVCGYLSCLRLNNFLDLYCLKFLPFLWLLELKSLFVAMCRCIMMHSLV